MNNQSIILSILTLLIYINSFIYSYYGLFLANISIKNILKCVPAAILVLYSFVLICYHQASNNTYARNMSCCLTVIYTFCVIGDSLLLVDDNIFTAVATIFFMLVYLILGFMNFFAISHEANPNSREKLYINISAFLYFIFFLFILAIINVKVNNTAEFTFMFIYLSIILLSINLSTYKFIICKNNQQGYFLVGMLSLAVSDILLLLNMAFIHKLLINVFVINIYWLGLLYIAYATKFFDESNIIYSRLYPPYINI